nr:hypothetical protein CFP56_13404 [Quercus suber]
MEDSDKKIPSSQVPNSQASSSQIQGGRNGTIMHNVLVPHTSTQRTHPHHSQRPDLQPLHKGSYASVSTDGLAHGNKGSTNTPGFVQTSLDRSISLAGFGSASNPAYLETPNIYYPSHVSPPSWMPQDQSSRASMSSAHTTVVPIDQASHHLHGPASSNRTDTKRPALQLSASAAPFIPLHRQRMVIFRKRPDEARLTEKQVFERKESSYWRVGRVFEAEWPQLAGDESSDDITLSSTHSQDGVRIFMKRRKFVVIEEGRKSCKVLYVRKADHCIIYTGDVAPEQKADEQPGRDEAAMKPHKLQVIATEKSDKLHPMSRLNLEKVFSPVEDNIEVRDFGHVCKQDILVLHDMYNKVKQAQHNTQKRRAKEHRADEYLQSLHS